MANPPTNAARVRITLDMLFFTEGDNANESARTLSRSMMEAAQEGLLREFAGRDVNSQFEVCLLEAGDILE